MKHEWGWHERKIQKREQRLRVTPDGVTPSAQASAEILVSGSNLGMGWRWSFEVCFYGGLSIRSLSRYLTDKAAQRAAIAAAETMFSGLEAIRAEENQP